MSISGISGSSFLQDFNPVAAQSKFQKFQQEFQQLGQDLQSGNLSQAQSDFATLQQNAPPGSPLSGSSTNSGTTAISQEFQQLSQDLKSGNLSAAQSDFANIQLTAQQDAAQGTQGHHHHHHHAADSSQDSSSNSPASALNQAWGQLGQDPQSGNLQSAQRAYASLQQDLQQFAGLGAASGSGPGSSSSASQRSVNITV